MCDIQLQWDCDISIERIRLVKTENPSAWATVNWKVCRIVLALYDINRSSLLRLGRLSQKLVKMGQAHRKFLFIKNKSYLLVILLKDNTSNPVTLWNTGLSALLYGNPKLFLVFLKSDVQWLHALFRNVTECEFYSWFCSDLFSRPNYSFL
jgi:hypothetical protein